MGSGRQGTLLRGCPPAFGLPLYSDAHSALSPRSGRAGRYAVHEPLTARSKLPKRRASSAHIQQLHDLVQTQALRMLQGVEAFTIQ